jgi:uncharacterized membrane protein YccC
MLRSRRKLLQILFQLEPGKPAIAKGLRAAIAIIVPIALVEYTGLSSLTWTALGGFEASIADVGGLYRTKAISMGLVAFGGTLSMFVGTLAGGTPTWAVFLAFLWTFVCGLISVYGNAMSTASTLVAVMFLIGLGIPGDLASAFQRSGMFLLGAILAMFLSLVLWPLRPYDPVRKAVGECYQHLSNLMKALFLLASQTAESKDAWNLSLSQKRIQLREALAAARSAIAQTRVNRQGTSPLGQRLLGLTEIADQLFISTAALSEVLESHKSGHPWEQFRVHIQLPIEQLSESCRTLAVAISSRRSKVSIDLWELDQAINQLKEELKKLRQATSQQLIDYSGFLVISYTVGIVDRLGQYIQAAADITQSCHDSLPHRRHSQRIETALEWKESPSILNVLQANLTPDSAVFRHALRLGVITAVAVTIYVIFGLREGYWVTLTVVVILKPYFGATFQRGLQRVIGTVFGGIVAAILAAIVHSPLSIALLLFPLTVIALALQPINYGLFVFFLTPQVILMDNILHPGHWLLALDRIENTALGGALALVGGYLLWPSREHRRLPQQFASTIDANRVYFQVVLAKYLGREVEEKSIQKALQKARRENTNAETAFQRLLNEPYKPQSNFEPLIALLASIHQFNYAVTTLATHLSQWSGHHQLPGLEQFAQQIEDLMADLTSSVRLGTPPEIMPSLEQTQKEIAEYLQQLQAVRMGELVANQGNTPTKEAVLDYTIVNIEVERITRIVTIMHSAISRTEAELGIGNRE